jgi:hypothetical protein
MKENSEEKPEMTTIKEEDAIDATDLTLADSPILVGEQLIIKGQQKVLAFKGIIDALGTLVKHGKKTYQLIPAIRICASGDILGYEEGRYEIWKEAHPTMEKKRHNEYFILKGLFDENTLKNDINVDPVNLRNILAAPIKKGNKKTGPESLVITVIPEGNKGDYQIAVAYYNANNERLFPTSGPSKNVKEVIELDEDQLKYTTSFEVAAKDFKKVAGICEEIGEKFDICADEDRVYISAGGEIGNFDKVACFATTPSTGNAIRGMQFNVEFMQDILALGKNSENMTVWVGQGYPMKVVFALKETGIAVCYLSGASRLR